MTQKNEEEAATPKPLYGLTDPAKLEYLERAKEATTRGSPDYTAIVVGGVLLFVLAAIGVIEALVLLFSGSVIEAIRMASYAVLLALVASVAFAVRDIARNSFRG